VACNTRLRQMSLMMAEQRGASAVWPEKQYCVDNGTMIAELGRRMLDVGFSTPLEASAVNSTLRTDHTLVNWN
jgi:tRNA A37 threonylcarbamoyltransferase TsaD